MNRTFEGIESAIKAHNEFNGVSANYTQEQLAEHTARIFDGLNGRTMDIGSAEPTPALS